MSIAGGPFFIASGNDIGGTIVIDAFRTKALIRRCVPGSLFRRRLHKTLLNPEWQQAIFVDKIEKLIGNRAGVRG